MTKQTLSGKHLRTIEMSLTKPFTDPMHQKEAKNPFTKY